METAVRHASQRVLVVSDNDDRGAGGFELQEHVDDRVLRLEVERRSRLVDKQKPRLRNDRARDVDSLLLAAAERRWIGVPQLFGKPEALEALLRGGMRVDRRSAPPDQALRHDLDGWHAGNR